MIDAFKTARKFKINCAGQALLIPMVESEKPDSYVRIHDVPVRDLDMATVLQQLGVDVVIVKSSQSYLFIVSLDCPDKDYFSHITMERLEDITIQLPRMIAKAYEVLGSFLEAASFSYH